MEKIITDGNRFAEVTLDGTECAVKFGSQYNGFEVYNTSGGEILVSVKSGGSKGEDGVISVADGEIINYMHYRRLDTVYITGTGAVKVAAKNEATRNFLSKRRGGDTAIKSGMIELTGVTTGYSVGTIIEEAEVEFPG